MMKLSLRWPFVGTPPVFPREGIPSTSARRTLPRPAIRWIGPLHNIALRPFDWASDIEKICAWQRETYALNFPHFEFTPDFINAFRNDLRRAMLDNHHALFVLDDAPSGGDTCGFIWVVLCQNNWTSEKYGYINNLYIVPEKRGLHLGEELLKHAEHWFKSRRVKKLRLTVTASNANAMKLYERTGFGVERFEMEKEIVP